MKRTITVERAALTAALAHCRRIIDRKNSIPVLGCVIIDEVEGRLRMRGTNLDVWIEAGLGPNNGEPLAGSIYLSPAPLTAWLAQIKADTITITDESGKNAKGTTTGEPSITLESTDGRMLIKDYIDLENPITQVANEVLPSRVVLGWHDAAATIKRVLASASDEGTRYYLNGIHVMQRGHGIYQAQATDGHRLFRESIVARSITGEVDPIPGKDRNGIIVPTGLCQAVMATFKAWPTVEIAVEAVTRRHTPPTEKNGVEIQPPPEPITQTEFVAIRFTDGDVTVWGKLIDGTFPDTDRVIPDITKDHIGIRVEIAAFKLALARVGAGYSGKRSQTVVLLPGKTQSMGIRASNDGLYSTYAELPLPQANALPGEVGFNRLYLASALAFMSPDKSGSGEIVMWVNKAVAGNPIVIVGANPGNSERLAILMPMRV